MSKQGQMAKKENDKNDLVGNRGDARNKKSKSKGE
jgi:hypothetical protein